MKRADVILLACGLVSLGIPAIFRDMERVASATFVVVGLAMLAVCALDRFREWRRPTANSTERLSIIEFFREAHRRGVYLFDDSHEIRRLCDRLKQDAAEGLLVIWGKARHHRGTFLHIPDQTWFEYEIDWPAAFDLDHSNGAIKGFPKEPENANFYVGARSTLDSSRKAYHDLSLTKSEALAWLDRYCTKRP